MLTTKVKSTIKKYSMLKPGDRVIVAVSGGPDSVCLLSVLQSFAKEFNIILHVAHLDHMFRGKESADEAMFVADIAKKFGLPATIEKIDVPAFCKERGLSAQAGAREVRYAFFSRAARHFNASCIATGHTTTDQAETFLMRLIRGAGSAGLSAIPPKRGNVIRPLIEVTREEVVQHLQTSGLSYVSDPSNEKPLYTRNRIRMQLLPVLKQFNPRIVETLAYEAALLRDEEEAAEACLSSIANGIIELEGDVVALKREVFNSLPLAFRRRVFRKAADTAGLESTRLSSVQIDEALAFMTAVQSGRAMSLHGLAIEREYSRFIIRVQARAENFLHTLNVPGVTGIPDLGLEVETLINEEVVLDAPLIENYFWQAQFDYDKIGPLLKLRNRLPGDKFCPAGMGGQSKKLQDYFVDQKVPRRKRNTLPLLVSGEDIVWVVGFRTDERFSPVAETKRILVVQLRPSDVRSEP